MKKISIIITLIIFSVWVYAGIVGRNDREIIVDKKIRDVLVSRLVRVFKVKKNEKNKYNNNNIDYF